MGERGADGARDELNSLLPADDTAGVSWVWLAKIER